MAFERIAALTWRHPRKVLALIGAFMVIAAVLGGRVEEHLQAAGFSDPDSESEIAVQELREELGYDAAPGIVVLVTNPDGETLRIRRPEVRREVRRLARRLREAAFVGRGVNPLAALEGAIRRSERAQRQRRRAAAEIRAGAEQAAEQAAAAGLPAGDPAAAAEQRIAELPKPPSKAELVERFRKRSPLVADDGSSVLITGHLASDDPEDEGAEAVEDARRLLDSDLVELGFGGFASGFSEVEDQTREDLTRAELIAFPVLALLLLLVFRSAIAAGIPLIVGVASILGTFLALRVMAEIVPTSLFALNITTALSLGLAVDYALLMISRYREELDQRGPTEEAHRQMVLTAGRTVFFSGITVAAALIALVFFPQRFLYSVGVAGAAVGLLASTIALLGVSSTIAILGERINSLSIRRPAAATAVERGGWYRIARAAMRRPAGMALLSAGVMLLAASPALATKLTGPSGEAVPPSQPSFAVQEQIEADYDRDVAEAITVTAAGEISDRELRRLNRRIGRLEGISTRAPFERTDGGELAYANFGPAGLALDGEPQEAVRQIRELEVGGAGSDVELRVSGNTARFIDQKRSLVDHLPVVAGISVAVTLLLLFLLTGSVVLPLITIVMNGLTLAAVLGIMTLGFQDGWLDGALSYTGPGAIELITMALVFAITFGLATDYAVLVLARIKEQHELGASTREAVAIGIGRTGRVISAAAMMLAVVFLAFATSKIFFMKQAAVGQAAGVLLDATIVRALLVPSLIALFGELCWWAPGPLKRFQSRFGISD